jgi:hypothetical protein
VSSVVAYAGPLNACMYLCWWVLFTLVLCCAAGLVHS